MDGSRRRIQGTDHQMLLLKKLHEDDKYLHVECFSICHNSGDRFEKYFDNLKQLQWEPIQQVLKMFTMNSFHAELNTISSIDSKC